MTLLGAPATSITAQGRILNANTGEPAYLNGLIRYGTREYPHAPDGRIEVPNLPRRARLWVNVPGYAVKTLDAAETEIRLRVGGTSLDVQEEGSPGTFVPRPDGASRDAGHRHRPAEGGGTSIPAPLSGDTDVRICATNQRPRLA